MFSSSLKRFLKHCLCVLFVGSLTVGLSAQLPAQTIQDLLDLIPPDGGGADGGGADGGGGGGAVDGGNGGGTGGGDTGGGVGGGGDGGDGGGAVNNNFLGGGGAGTTDGGENVNLDGAAELDFGGVPDMRNQGFVGATAPGITENGFVGAGSQTFGELAEGATFGGGVNDSATSSIPSGSGGGGAGGFNGANAGGSVIRSNLRTRLRPAFAAPSIPSRVVEGNFNSNLARQPTAQSLVGRYQVRIENKTAIVTGVVDTQADADRLIRQLRLQPGVYGIVSQLQVAR